jgi:transketolase
MRDTFSMALHDVAKKTKDVFIVVADISPAASMEPFRKEFPERFINVGVSEQSMISLCAGLALSGAKPFAYTIAPFAIYRPFEHIRVELCYQNIPTTIVGVGAGLSYSVAGATHNAIEDIAVMTSLPNMSVIAPCDPEELRSAVQACVEHTSPIYLRLGKAGEPDLTKNAPEPFKFGAIRKIKAGENTAIIGYGPILSMAFDAANAMRNKFGIEVAIYSAHTLKPLDLRSLENILKEYSKVVVLEEAISEGGLATKVKQLAWDIGAKCQIKTIGLQDEFIKCYGSKIDLLAAHGITANLIASQLEN